MKINFVVSWKKFKSDAMKASAEEYAGRIAHFAPCKIILSGEPKKDAGTVLWLCDTVKSAKMLSSEDLAACLRQFENSGTREWTIAVGGPDGFSQKEKIAWQPDFLWSFGPMTLPHELALVVAAEQVYRAYSILRGLPYHKGH